MAFKIFEEKSNKEIQLRLVEDDGDIDLVVVDSDGDIMEHILSITSAGKLKLYHNISDDLGFKLDSDDKLIIEDN